MTTPSGKVSTPSNHHLNISDHDDDDLNDRFAVSSPSSRVSSLSNTVALQLQSITHKEPWRKLLKNELFCSRVIVMPPAIFILFLSISYTISTILNLTLDDYWCDVVTLQQIREHSQAENLKNGEFDRCWDISGSVRDKKKLWNKQSYGFEVINLGNDVSALLRFIVLLIISIIITLLIIYYMIQLILDITKYRNGTLGSITYKAQNVSVPPNTSNNISIGTKTYNYYLVFYTWYNKTFRVDTGKWIILKIFGEIAEILIQSQALLAYNGTPIISTNTVYLSYEKQFIVLFAIFLFLNCVSCSILWLFYAFKPKLCNGLLFQLILVSTDIMFDAFYAFFPLIAIIVNNRDESTSNDDGSFLISLASLQTDNLLTFFAAAIPLIFLVYKFYALSWSASFAMKEYFRISNSLKKSRSQQYASNIQMTNTPNTRSRVNTKIVIQNASITTATFTKSWILDNQKYNIKLSGWRDYINHRYSRQSIITVVSIIFSIYGIVILQQVIAHFNYAVPYCHQLVTESAEYYNNMENGTDILFNINDNDLYNNKPELFLFHHCLSPVYPFHTICDCRIFRFEYDNLDSIKWNNITQLKQVFNIDILDALKKVMTTFKMMEKFEINGIRLAFDGYDESQLMELGITTKLNLSEDVFGSKRLQIFNLVEVPTTDYISEAIGTLQILQFLTIWGVEIVHYPETMKYLKNLQYIALSGLVDIDHAISELPPLCSFIHLKALQIRTSRIITEVPYCLHDLNELQIIYIHAMPNLMNISLKIFNLPNLRNLNLEFSYNLSLETLMNYNGISNDGNYIFKYNKNAKYNLAESGLCKINKNTPSSFISFLNITNSCNKVCDTKAFEILCVQSSWQDGICDDGCNDQQCEWDGGDCAQLCPYIDNWKELGNGICNETFNITQCNYDQCDCIPNTYYNAKRYEEEGCLPLIDNETYCDITYEKHECDIEWVNDGWCDNNCQQSFECEYDGDDCINSKSCDQGTKCYGVSSIFRFASNLITMDDKASENEICSRWQYIGSQYMTKTNITNCNQVLSIYDINNDQQLSLHEFIIAVPEQWGITQSKANQIDCSECLNNPIDYH